MDWVAFEGDDAYYYHEQDSWWPGRQSSGRTKIGTRGQGDLIQLDGAFQRDGRSMVEIGLLNEYAAGDFSGDGGWGMTSAKLNIRKAQSGNLPFSAWTAVGSELHDQNVKSSIVIYNGMTFGFDSDAQREVPLIIAEAKANGDNLTLAGYGFGEGGGRGLTAALGARGLQFGLPLLARGAAAIPYGTATLTGLGKGLQVAGAAGTGWFAGTAINEGLHGNAYEATSALTDATNLGVGSFGALIPRRIPGIAGTVRVVETTTSGLVTIESQAVTQAGKTVGSFNGIFNPTTGIFKAGLMEVDAGFRGAGVGGMLFDDVMQATGGGVRQIDSFLVMTNRLAYLRAVNRWFFPMSHEEAVMQMPAARIRASRGWTSLDYDPNTSILRARRP